MPADINHTAFGCTGTAAVVAQACANATTREEEKKKKSSGVTLKMAVQSCHSCARAAADKKVMSGQAIQGEAAGIQPGVSL